MLVGLVSDTHDNVVLLRKAVLEFKNRDIKVVIHSGDVCAPITLKELHNFKVYLVLGNTDGDVIKLKETVESMNGVFLGFGGSFVLDNKKFAVFHGHYSFILDSLIRSQEFDFVIHGHTHRRRNELIGKTRVINPGCLYRTHENSVAVLDTNTGDVEFIMLSDD